MNFVHVLLQVKGKLEELTTGDALVWLLPKVDGLVVAPHVAKVTENLVARGVGAREVLTKMDCPVVRHHRSLGSK